MNSRERVRKAINFEKPDRIPIDLGSMRASGINVVAYDHLKRAVGLHTPTKVQGTMDMLALVEDEVLDKLHVDVVPLEGPLAAWDESPASAGVPKTLPTGTEVYFPPGTDITTGADGSWFLRDAAREPYAQMPREGFYFDYIKPASSGGTIDPAKFKPPTTVPDQTLEAFARRATRLYRDTDKAILGWGAGISFLGLSFLLTDNITQNCLDEWLCMLMTEKAAAHDMMARGVDAAIECIKLYHQAAGDKVMIWGIASDDAGTQRAGVIAPELFAEMIKPHYKRLCGWVHANTPWKTFVHSCGSIYEYIPHWIEAGVDILNPIQISAANMEPQRLVREFGGKVVFWGGGCETQQMLPLGTPQQIRRHVQQNIATFGRAGGGFVFTQVHNIQPNVPTQNILAMYEAAYEFGKPGPISRTPSPQ